MDMESDKQFYATSKIFRLIFKQSSLKNSFLNKEVAAETPKGGVAGALEPIILKAWSPGAQKIPMAIFSNFKK